MNLLIIGNGFDLAHNLPTKYTDFLIYCRDYDKANPVAGSDEMNEEFISFVTDNIWLKYFLQITEFDGSETWIDFEKEISEVVRNIDKSNLRIGSDHDFTLPSPVSKKVKSFVLSFTNYEYPRYKIKRSDITDINSFIKFIYLQLREFTRAFEIYCVKINDTPIKEPIITSEKKKQIDEAETKVKFSDRTVQEAKDHSASYDATVELEKSREEARKTLSSLRSGMKLIDYLSMSYFSCVLSFNYTNTYQRLYGSDKTRYCYIHGKAQENKNKTNMVFGIDDSLPRGEESNNFKWANFKKYYQRIIFKTGSEYKDWLKQAEQYPSNYVYIVGHSLDRTDYDVLYEIFSNKFFKIIVYYYNEEDFEDKVQKVIKLLAYEGKNGRDELISRVHGSQWSIKFIDQYDEKDGLFIKNEREADTDT